MPKPIKTTEVAIQSVRESIAVALRADEEIFFDIALLKKNIHSFTQIEPIRIHTDNKVIAVLSSGLIIFSIDDFKSSTPTRIIAHDIPKPATYSYLP
jgi:hypothetical protein